MRGYLTAAPIALALAVLTGAEQKWHRDGATEPNYSADQKDCSRGAFGLSQNYLLAYALVFHQCMQQKGWALRD